MFSFPTTFYFLIINSLGACHPDFNFPKLQKNRRSPGDKGVRGPIIGKALTAKLCLGLSECKVELFLLYKTEFSADEYYFISEQFKSYLGLKFIIIPTFSL